MLNENELNRYLQTSKIGRNFIQFDEIDSTNLFLKNSNLNNLQNGLLVFAEHQTNGYGRFSRTWVSEKNKNLLFSILITDEFNNSKSLLPLVCALSVSSAIEIITNIETEIKWPNDVLINSKKTAGILIENKKNDLINYLIIGIGINVNQKSFPDELLKKSTSISNEVKKEISREELLAIFLNEFEKNITKLINGNSKSLLENCISKCKMLGKKIFITKQNETFSGLAVSLSEEGMLNFRNSNGVEETFSSGDVTINLNLKE